MPIRKPFVFKGLVDLSWNRYNLYNLYQYSKAGPERDINKTAFQLKWRAKQLTIPYHAPQVTQTNFRKLQQRHLPRIKRTVIDEAKRSKLLTGGAKGSVIPMPPTTMLMFSFMERRVDTILFRSCFVPSIWDARYLINTGAVAVNGKRIKLGGYVCEDGDIIQVLRPEKLALLNGKHMALGEDFEVTRYEAKSEDAASGEVDPVQVQRKRMNRNLPVSKQMYKFHPVPYMAPWMFVPEYLEVNYNNLTVCFLRSPTIKPGRCEIPSPYDELVHQRTFDLYSRYHVPF